MCSHGFGHHPFCGETCLDPKKFGIYHIFEKNLTEATETHPCSHQFTQDGGFYSNYTKTVTHGVPGVLAVTLDLYAEPTKVVDEKTIKNTVTVEDTPCCANPCTAPLVKYYSVE